MKAPPIYPFFSLYWDSLIQDFLLIQNISLYFCCIDFVKLITTIIIEILAVRTSLFLFPFSPWRYDERETILYCHPYARRILWSLRSQLVSATRDPNWSALIRSEKPNRPLQQPNLNYPSFQNPQIPRTISSRYDVNHPLNSPERPSCPIYSLGF